MTATITPSPVDPLGLEPIPNDTRERFLRFKLSGKYKTLLPLENIAEVRPLAIVDILPIPESSSAMLGVCNWRGEILWLIDLNVLVGDTPLWHQAPLLEETFAIVVQSGQQSVGLVVEHVDDVELIEPESIHHQPDLCSAELARFVAGHLPDHQGLVLDTAAIIKQSFQTPP